MARSSDETTPQGRGDRHWVERIAAAYGPGPRTAVQRAAFKARLRERLERRPRWFAGAPAWVMVGIAALLLCAALPRWVEPPAPDTPLIPGAAAESINPGEWEERVLYGEAAPASFPDEIDAGLPAGHAAVAVVFLED